MNRANTVACTGADDIWAANEDRRADDAVAVPTPQNFFAAYVNIANTRTYMANYGFQLE